MPRATHKLGERQTAKLKRELAAGRGGAEVTSLLLNGYSEFLGSEGEDVPLTELHAEHRAHQVGMLIDMMDLRRRTFGPHPTAQDWRAASKASIEQALAADVIRRSPKLYAGYDEDAVKFVRNTMGTTKWDLLLAAESFGLAPQGTYLYPDERKRQERPGGS